MQQAPPPISELMHRLNTMAEYVRAIAERADLDWSWRPADLDWSLNEIACHLRDVEREVNQWRFRTLAENENVFIPGVAADEWAEERHYQQQNGPQALDEFILVRTETITLLQSFSLDMWGRQGRHAFLGSTTMHELLHIVVRHDELHRKQIQEMLAGWEIEFGSFT